MLQIWQFENNYQPETGLVNAVDTYPSTTMWDTASYMGALMAAYELRIIDKQVFDAECLFAIRFSTFDRVDRGRKCLDSSVVVPDREG